MIKEYACVHHATVIIGMMYSCMKLYEFVIFMSVIMNVCVRMNVCELKSEIHTG